MIFSDATRAGVWAMQCSATQIQEDKDCNEEGMVLVAEREEEESVVKVGI